MGCGSSNAVIQVAPTDGSPPSKAYINSMVKAARKKTGIDSKFCATLGNLFFTLAPNNKMTSKTFVSFFLAFHDQKNDNKLFVDFLERLFRAFDVDNGGYIDFMEFVQTIHSVIGGTLTDVLNTIFRLCDTDRSGEIDRTEFLSTIKTIAAFIDKAKGITVKTLVRFGNYSFDKMDSDKSGEVDMGEFVSALLADDDDVTPIVILLEKALISVICGKPPIPKQVTALEDEEEEEAQDDKKD